MGQSGVGKTSYVRSIVPKEELYIKQRNKWWDGYRGEQVAIMDDLQPEHSEHLAAYVKDWTDRYGFKAEVKGGSLFPNIRQFFITTQFTLQQLFPKKEDQDAVERRCKIMVF